MRTDNRTLWIAVAELVVLALLTMLTHWRWGNIAYWIAFFLVVPAIVVAIWFRDYFQACLALIAVVLLIQAICVTVAFRNRLREQADTVASMRRIAAAVSQYASTHRGMYPDGAHFPAIMHYYDAGAPLNDAWGSPIRYTAIDRLGLPTGLGAGPGFIVQSAGSNLIPEPNYIGDVYNWPRKVLGIYDTVTGKDLLMLNGVFVQGPRI